MGNPASVSCAENIALFHFLHAGRGKDGALWRDSVPALPSVAPAEALLTNQKDCILSLERERSLAGALAFISHVDDDPDHIPAICVQEDHDPREQPSLRVLLAVNKSSCKDGDDILERIGRNLEGIFEELSKVIDDNDDQLEIEHKIRRLIVSMCSGRILSRLRLTTSERRKTKQHPKLRFQNVIRALAVHEKTTMMSSDIAIISAEERRIFVDRLRDVVNLIDIYTNHPRPQQLEDLVDAFFRLRHLDCQALLNAIPDEHIEKSNRKSTLNMIQKVARYAEAARFLFRTSKKFPIARRMRAMAVHLPETAFYRAPLSAEHSISFSSMLSRLKAPRSQSIVDPKSQANIVCLLLGTTPDQADDDITKQTIRTYKTGKIHAEVQLVLHYDILRHSRPSKDAILLPRIVSSSKKACFLCDLLIKMHGKMRTPWSHGKLYPGWRVPNYQGMHLQKRFNSFLEDRIRESIVLLFERRGRTSYPGPSESTLVTLPSLQSEPVIVCIPKEESRVEVSEVQVQDIESVAEDESGTSETDKEDLEPRSAARLRAANVSHIDEQTADEAIASVESESCSVSKHTPVDLSHIIEKKPKAGSEKAEPVAHGQPIYEGPGKDTQHVQATSSPKSESHVEGITHDDLQSEDGDLCDIPNEAVSSPWPEEPLLRSPKSCVDGANSLEAYHHLQEGQRLSQTLLAEQIKTFFTRSLVVQVEYSTGPSLEAAVGKQHPELAFEIERLGADEVVKLKHEGTLLLENEEAFIGETPLVLPSMDRVYVAARGVVFKITFC